jgi:hypothetical protein
MEDGMTKKDTTSTAEKTTELATTTLRGDIRDKILSEFKAIPKSWQTSSEDEQARLINRAKDIADTLVRRAIDIIAAKGLPALAITVGKMTIDNSECKGTFECYADDESLLRIRHLQGSRAMFVLASPDAFNGEQKQAETTNVGDLAMPKGDEPRADEAALASVGKGKATNGAAAHG